MPKSVLITGCSAGGIGHALARSFASRGLTVFATARNPSSMVDLEQLPNVHLLSLNVTSTASVAMAVAAVKEKTGSLHYVVNNAGMGHYLPALDTDIEEAKKVMDVNFWGQLRVSQGFAPLLIASKGTIVNIGSIAAFMNRPYNCIYTASKAGGHALGEILRLELAPFGVKVLTVITGCIGTALHDKILPPKLIDGSIYSSLGGKLEDIANTKDPTDQDPESYAEGVVEDVLAGKTGKVWHGKNSSLIKYGHVLLPQFYIDYNMTSNSGLETLRKP
ncbi:oxidoreductase [Lophiotrema nucula]|uniref:Oxidoreductase n=1 Tax=Lophiotrema nucula TaxID=690887 RepID=A0A6A5YYU4_9PLEO|nr:oxidoreductase [Lophiotrema nucula]